MKKFLLLLVVFSLCFCSCKDKHDYTPAILEISEDAFDDCFNVSNYNNVHETSWDEDAIQVMGQHRFTHVQVSFGGEVLGVWELPCSIPILNVNSDDSTYVNIVPCFKKNGQSSTIKGYGYIKSYKYPLLLKKGSTTSINKESMRGFFEYHKDAIFELIEPFNSQNYFSPYKTSESIVNFDCVADPTPGNTGNKVGLLTLTEDSLRGSFCIATSSELNLKVNYLTYMEIRYKCENDLNIEIFAPNYISSYPCGGLYATDHWVTAYINLDETLVRIYNSGSIGSGYIRAKIILSGNKLEDCDTHYWIDYVKIITGPQS